MLIGYARVSTQDQNLDLQMEALRTANCEKIFDDKISGSRAARPGLIKAWEAVHEGHTPVVWKLDRLGCSVKNLVDDVQQLHKQGVQFQSRAKTSRWTHSLSAQGPRVPPSIRCNR